MWAKTKPISLATEESLVIQRPDILTALISAQTGTTFPSLFSSREWVNNNGIQVLKLKCSGDSTTVLITTYLRFIWVTCGHPRTQMHIFREPCPGLHPATLTAHWA